MVTVALPLNISVKTKFLDIRIERIVHLSLLKLIGAGVYKNLPYSTALLDGQTDPTCRYSNSFASFSGFRQIAAAVAMFHQMRVLSHYHARLNGYSALIDLVPSWGWLVPSWGWNYWTRS